MTAWERDLKDLISMAHGGQLDATAGGTGDNTEDNGEWVDCKGYQSVVLALAVEAALQEGETATIDMNAQTAATSGGTPADFGDAATQVVLTGGSGGSTERTVVELGLNLNHSEFLGFIRGQYTVDLSATGTDTARLSLVVIRGGAAEKP